MAGPGLSHILEIAKRGLFAQQVGIDITGHNTANATTPGYSRQRVDMKTGEVLKTSQGLLGSGVFGSNGGRIRDAFIDEQVRDSQSALSDATTQSETLSAIESKINDLTVNGLGSQLTKFFNSFQSLAQQPEDLVLRTNVVNQGRKLTDAFHNSWQAYQTAQKNVVDQTNIVLTRINELSKEIADTDLQVMRLQATGSDPSDAKDRRDLLIDELSKLANVKVSEDSKGSVLVSIGGVVVASRGGATELQIATVDYDTTFENQDVTQPKLVIVVPPFNEDSADTPDQRVVNITSGQLNGYLQAYNGILTPGIMRLNNMANILIDKVNTLHEDGSGRYNPETGDVSSGIDFFNPDIITEPDDLVLGNSAKLITLSDDVLHDANTVAASGPDNDAPGDNQTALAISKLLSQRVLLADSNDDPTLSFEEYNHLNVDDLANSIFDASTNQESSQIILQQMQSKQQEVSGVSTDEEMSNLIKYQRSYDAAAKVATTVNDMYQTILNMI